MMDYPELVAHATELDTATDVHAWALEGRQLAVDVVYRHGTLLGTSNRAPTVLPLLPGDYAAKARPLAERRIVLAGDRMAQLIARLQS